MIIEKWKIYSREILLKAHVFRYQKVKSQSPNTMEIGEFDVVQCLNWVNVIAMTKEGNVVLVKQYRHGIEDVSLEIPGGAVHQGEDLLEAAKRELLEETGYSSEDWIKLGQVDANPAFMNNFCVTFLAKNAEKTSLQSLDPFEEIEVNLKPFIEIRPAILSGEISHSLVAAAFYLLGESYLAGVGVTTK